MTIASKHFDPYLGIDIHMTVFPPLPTPLPIPTPHIGMVLDPFDYVPFIGATVHVNGVKRGTAGTGGICIHIPLGVWLPPFRLPMGPQWMDDEVFMGSKTVLADGDPFSRIAEPVLDCNFFGLIPPIRMKAKKKVPLSLVLPTAVNLSIPTNVLIGGPSTVNWMALAFRAGFAGLGKLRKTDLYKAKMDAFANWRRAKFGNLPSGFLKCKVLRAEPVDIRDGSVAVSHQDFDVPGRLPLVWNRDYSSTASQSAGACGYGWETPADIRLECHADGTVLFAAPQQRAWFQRMPRSAGMAGEELEFADGARLSRTEEGGREFKVRTKPGVSYVFTDTENDILPRVLAIDRIEDTCGNSWRFERSDGHLTRIVESGTGTMPGRFIEVHANRGKLLQLKLHDPATGLNYKLVGYRYNDAGDLVAALDPLDAARTFEYQDHRMLRHTDRLGLSFHYGYDRQWRVVHAWGDGGLYDYRFKYDALLSETEVTDSLGAVSVVKFDESGLPLCEIDPLDGVTVFEYDDCGRTTAVVDPMGLRTEFEYDERGNLLKLVQPDGSATLSEYDEQDGLVRVVDPAGHAWTQRNDDRGLMRSQTDPLGATSDYQWDRHGQLVLHTNPRGATTQLTYDRYGQLDTLIDPLKHVSRFEHDALGRLLRQTDPLGQATSYEYDAKGRLLVIRAPGSGEVRCEYDAEDQLVRYVDEAGAQTRLKYVGIGQIGKRIQPDGHSVEYHYDTEEQLVGLTNQRGERYGLKRDALGRIVEEVDYWGQSRHYQYDAAGRLTSTTDPLGQRILFDTDKLGRILKKTLPDVAHPGQQVHESFKYDKRGQLVELRNRNRLVKRAFDPAGQLQEELQDGFHITHQYDEAGNRVLRQSSAGNRLACSYDLRNQVVEVAINTEAPIIFTRDALGRTTREQLSEAVQRQFQYDARNLLTSQHVLRDAAPLFDTAYDYDRAGNLARRSDSQQGRDEYQYDVLGRLLQHTDPKGRIARFFNDPAGDRLNTRIKQVQMKRIVGGDHEAETLWTREGDYEGQHYVFDRAGDLVRRGSSEQPAADDLVLTWDANHRLAESSKNGQRTQYGYDPLGRRVYKRNPVCTTWFYWDGDALLGEVEQANDDPDVAPLWVGNVANLIEARKRQEKLKTLHRRAREYVYYPNTFVPLALVDPQPAVSRPTLSATAPPAVAPLPQPKIQFDRLAHAVKAELPTTVAAEWTEPERPQSENRHGLGTLGKFGLGSEPVLVKPADSADARSVLGNLGEARLGGIPSRDTPIHKVQQDACSADPAKSTNDIDTAAAVVLPETLVNVEAVEQASGIKYLSEEITDATAESSKKFAGSAVYHYHVDPNGCPTRITDDIGEVVWSASYAAWGNMASRYSSRIISSLRFQGQYLDEETGLHYNRYRYYDPNTGQYVGQDPIGLFGGMNLYRYAPNPNTWSDALGLKGGSGRLDNAMGGAPGDGMQAHHLIPEEVMDNPRYKDMFDHLKSMGFDPDGAANGIHLPGSARLAQMIGLPGHWSNHPQYTGMINSQIDALYKEWSRGSLSDMQLGLGIRHIQTNAANAIESGRVPRALTNACRLG